MRSMPLATSNDRGRERVQPGIVGIACVLSRDKNEGAPGISGSAFGRTAFRSVGVFQDAAGPQVFPVSRSTFGELRDARSGHVPIEGERSHGAGA